MMCLHYTIYIGVLAALAGRPMPNARAANDSELSTRSRLEW